MSRNFKTIIALSTFTGSFCGLNHGLYTANNVCFVKNNMNNREIIFDGVCFSIIVTTYGIMGSIIGASTVYASPILLPYIYYTNLIKNTLP